MAGFPTEIMVAAVPLIVSPIVTPIVAWVVGRSRVAKNSAAIDYFNKRLDFLERLTKLQAQLADGPIRPLMDAEIKYCREFLDQPPAFVPHHAEGELSEPQSLLARFFLTRPAVSLRKRI